MAEEVSLNLKEKNEALDKILKFLKLKALENIGSETIDGIVHYHANFEDQNGVGFSFVCSAHKDGDSEQGLHVIRMVDIAISWGNFYTIFESGGGEIYNKTKEIVGSLATHCRTQNSEARNQLLS